MKVREGLKGSLRSRALEDNSGAARRAHLRLVVGVFSSHVQLHGCSYGINRALDLTRVVVLSREENLREGQENEGECTGTMIMTEHDIEAG